MAINLFALTDRCIPNQQLLYDFVLHSRDATYIIYHEITAKWYCCKIAAENFPVEQTIQFGSLSVLIRNNLSGDLINGETTICSYNWEQNQLLIVNKYSHDRFYNIMLGMDELNNPYCVIFFSLEYKIQSSKSLSIGANASCREIQF